jgi:isocitrate/isopropylmalate dehydrogenase
MLISKNIFLQNQEKEATAKIENAVIRVLSEGKVRTVDLGGSASTDEMANAVVAKLKAA